MALSSLQTSNTITVAGINTAVSVSINGGEYQIGSGSFVSTPGTVNNGNTVTVRHTSSAAFSTATTTALTIGTVSADFVSTTVAATVVNGACGSSANVTTAFLPTANLCSAGTAEPVTPGTSSWAWSCTGTGVGTTNATCSAPYPPVISGGGTVGAIQAQNANNWQIDQALSGFVALPAPAPAGVTLSGGATKVVLNTGTAGTSTTVTLRFSSIPAGAQLYKYGKENGLGDTDRWFAYPATIDHAAGTVTYTLTDGQRGDNDWTANSVIDDPVALGGIAPGTDSTPDAFSFTAVNGVALSTLQTSNTITVAGINTAASISITGGEYQIGSVGYFNIPGTVNNGDTVTVRHTSSAAHSTATTTTLTIGGVSANFVSTTLTLVTPPVTPSKPIPIVITPPQVPGVGSNLLSPLNLSSGDGPAMTTCLRDQLRIVIGANAVYLGQTADGGARIGHTGLVVSFYTLDASTSTSNGLGQGPGIYLRGTNPLNVVTSCGTFTTVPAVYNLGEWGVFLNGMGLSAQFNAQGVMTVVVGGATYVARPDYVVTQVDPGTLTGTPRLVTGSDGLMRFTDSAGNVQILYPAFIDPETLGNQIAQAVGGYTLIQTDGTALVTLFGGQKFLLTPDMTLGTVPPDQFAAGWWQDGPDHYRYRISSFSPTSQGFTVRVAP